MKRTIWFRSICYALAAVLVAYASTAIMAEVTRPAFRAADMFSKTPGPEDGKARSTAAWLSINGPVLSDEAALQAHAALHAGPGIAPASITDAQAALLSALAISPINSTGWLLLGQLKTHAGELATGALKMSYLTGPVSPEAMSARLGAVTSSGAIGDEDIGLLAQSDVRTILTTQRHMVPALIASFQQASPAGRKFLLDAAQAVDPKFSDTLRQNP